MKFVHLHVHTHYSLLDGLTKIDELIETAKNDGCEAVAISDHGVMYGVIEFYQKCKKAGIKPIIGVEAYVANGSRSSKVTRDDEKNNHHLLLLAKNNVGYKNLIKLTTIAHLEGYYYKPRIDWELLQQYKEGLIACTACLGGEIPTLIWNGKFDRAKQRIIEFNELFGSGNFYLELQHHPHLEGQEKINQKLIEFSRELNVPLVATNDMHYLRKEDDEAQDILLCLQNKKKKEDSDRMNMTGEDYSMKSSIEMIESFRDVPEAIENTVKIAEMCNVEIELGNIQLPYFQVPEGFDEYTYLHKWCEDGLVKRYGKSYSEVGQAIRERLDYELSVIKGMGWPSYFLIVADFVNWAKEQKIVVGPGRGSAAGSLVCYVTGITNIDPLKYDLLFERFLNPDRISMPDIDLDFADIRRGEVIKYVEDKYGKDHVGQIITFGTMAARAAVRDVGRVLGYPYEFCDRLAKAIPMMTKIDQALEIADEFKQLYKSDEAARKVIDYARRLEGVARHASTHACGVVITKEPLTEYLPMQYASSTDRSIVTQYSLHPIEDLGLLKMDFLGLKNLTIIESAIKIIKSTRGINVDIDNIPLDNKSAYKLFQDGETTGVFQFESSGMKRYLRELKPTEFEDIIAMVALYRPGPMEWIPDYISGKNGKKKPTYLHKKLEPILAKTYGVAIYQEQVMQIARDLAGFTMAEADVLRKAMGKKIAKLLNEQKKKFIEGCVKNGIASELAEKIFAFIEPFAGYGFNRSHAACYALIAYQTAYLKALWPTEFMAALLSSDQQDIDRVAIEIQECQRMNTTVTRPDVNQSYGSFTVVTSGTAENKIAREDEIVNTIRFGLGAIKNIGDHIAEVLIAERKKNGVFKNISDLLERITDKDLNKKSLESLIRCGALDDFGERGMLLGNLENMLNYNKELAKEKNNNQASLFGDSPALNMSHQIKLSSYPSADRQLKLSWEKELLGLYITEHPFHDFKKILGDKAVSLGQLSSLSRNQSVNVAGIITKVQKIITRTNKSMMFVKLEDDTSNIEILVFPNLLAENPDIWKEGNVLLIEGKLSDKEHELKLLANKAVRVDLDNPGAISGFKKIKNKPIEGQAKNESPSELKIFFNNQPNAEIISKLNDILKRFPGKEKVLLGFRVNGDIKIIEIDLKVEKCHQLMQAVKDVFNGEIAIK